MKKKCNKCNELLELSNFEKNKSCKDGHAGTCKKCRLEQKKKYIKECEYCGKEFRTQYKDTKYCSKPCLPQNRERKVEVACFVCGKRVMRTKSQADRPEYNYCSRECLAEHQKVLFRGENSSRYNKNLTLEERLRDRKYTEYRYWRNDVFKRDNYTCQCCGDNKGGNLHAHHIFNYMRNKDLRLELTNGITLCEICHKRFHDIYGYYNNNDVQLNDFLNKYGNTEPSQGETR